MEEGTEKDRIFGDIESLVAGLGMSLVEFSVVKSRGSNQARAVLFSPKGVGINECSKVHRLIQPRLQVLLGDPDVGVEVSSPGVDRWIKENREYAIFTGKGIRAYSRSRNDWVAGILVASDGISLEIRGPSGTEKVEITDIAKARLDYSQEVK